MPDVETEDIHEGQIFSADGVTLLSCFLPGHCEDHYGFVVAEDAALISGDCILGCGTTTFNNLSEYMESLQKVLLMTVGSTKLCTSPIRSIYPGHGPIARDNAQTKVLDYIEHRENREIEILEALKENLISTSWQITQHIYGDQNLFFPVLLSAQQNVSLTLQRLVKRGDAIAFWPDRWKSNANKKAN